MEELKTEELEQLTKALQNTDNIKTSTELIDNEIQKNIQSNLIDKSENNSQEVQSETPNESVEFQASNEMVDIKNEDANTTNCLALTIQEDHKLVAFKNVFLRSIRMSWKVVVSAITLALIKLFS